MATETLHLESFDSGNAANPNNALGAADGLYAGSATVASWQGAWWFPAFSYGEVDATLRIYNLTNTNGATYTFAIGTAWGEQIWTASGAVPGNPFELTVPGASFAGLPDNVQLYLSVTATGPKSKGQYANFALDAVDFIVTPAAPEVILTATSSMVVDGEIVYIPHDRWQAAAYALNPVGYLTLDGPTFGFNGMFCYWNYQIPAGGYRDEIDYAITYLQPATDLVPSHVPGTTACAYSYSNAPNAPVYLGQRASNSLVVTWRGSSYGTSGRMIYGNITYFTDGTQVGLNAGSTPLYRGASLPWTDGQTHLLVFTEAPDGTASVYCDNVLVGTAQGTYVAPVGACQTDTAAQVTADEIFLYDYVLTAADVASLWRGWNLTSVATLTATSALTATGAAVPGAVPELVASSALTVAATRGVRAQAILQATSAMETFGIAGVGLLLRGVSDLSTFVQMTRVAEADLMQASALTGEGGDWPRILGVAQLIAASSMPVVPKIEYEDAVLASGPAAYWPMQETSGGTLEALSGTGGAHTSGMDLVLQGSSYELGQPGIPTRQGYQPRLALRVLATASRETLAQPTATDTVSVSGADQSWEWILHPAAAIGGTVVETIFYCMNSIRLLTSSYGMDFTFDLSFGSGGVEGTGDRWQHMVVTREYVGPSGDQTYPYLFQLTGYVNGQQVASGTQKSPYYGGYYTATPILSTATADYLISDVAIYSKALAASDVATHWAALGYQQADVTMSSRSAFLPLDPRSDWTDAIIALRPDYWMPLHNSNASLIGSMSVSADYHWYASGGQALVPNESGQSCMTLGNSTMYTSTVQATAVSPRTAFDYAGRQLVVPFTQMLTRKDSRSAYASGQGIFQFTYNASKGGLVCPDQYSSLIYPTADGSVPWLDGRSHLFVATYSADEVCLYVDGVLVGSVSMSALWFPVPGWGHQAQVNETDWFAHYIAMYEVLSAADVAVLYQTWSETPGVQLVAFSDMFAEAGGPNAEVGNVIAISTATMVVTSTIVDLVSALLDAVSSLSAEGDRVILGDDWRWPFDETGNGSLSIDLTTMTEDDPDEAGLGNTAWVLYTPPDSAAGDMVTLVGDANMVYDVLDTDVVEQQGGLTGTNTVMFGGPAYVRVRPADPASPQTVTLSWTYAARTVTTLIVTVVDDVGYTPGVLSVVISGGDADATLSFTVDADPTVVDTAVLDDDGSASTDVDIPALDAGTHTLNVLDSAGTTLDSVSFDVEYGTLDSSGDNDPTGALTQPTGVTPTVNRWTLVDDHGSSVVSYELPRNPSSWTSPDRTKYLTFDSTTAPDGRILVWQNASRAWDMSFSGVLISEAEHADLLTWAAKRYRFWLVDHRGTWWYLTITQPDFQLRANVPDGEWVADYTIHCLVFNSPAPGNVPFDVSQGAQ